MMQRTVRLNPVVSLAPFVQGGQLVAFDVGPDGLVYLAIAHKPLDYRTVEPGGGSFAKTLPAQPQTYRVIGLSGSRAVFDVTIEQEPFNIHHIQPLKDELLLVCARSRFKGPDDFEKNGRVYLRDGKFSRDLLLGDGIKSVQAAGDGSIWTSYFDEGVFGNYGWNLPVGASGLIAWNSAGEKLYEFEPACGLDSICDCYALNVESERDVWLYYYTDFPLVRLRDRKIESVWITGLHGSDVFAVSDGHALFRGGYKDRDTYHLFSLGSNRDVKLISKIELEDTSGRKLMPERIAARGRDSFY